MIGNDSINFFVEQTIPLSSSVDNKCRYKTSLLKTMKTRVYKQGFALDHIIIPKGELGSFKNNKMRCRMGYHHI